MHLADQGADVIKIEQPGVGDLVRHLGPQRGGMTAIFAVINRNKRSVELDLKTDEGKATLARIVETADVVVQNFRPGVVERMGIGYEDLRQHRADLARVPRRILDAAIALLVVRPIAVGRAGSQHQQRAQQQGEEDAARPPRRARHARRCRGRGGCG